MVGQFVLPYSSTQESHQFLKIFLGKYVELNWFFSGVENIPLSSPYLS